MKKSLNLKVMFISLFAAMSMTMDADVVEYNTNGFKFKLDTETKTAKLAEYCGSAKEVIIPGSVTYNDVAYSVTTIDGMCFDNSKFITSVTIPSSITSLVASAFYRCNSLTSIIVDEDNPVYDSRENCNAIIETESNTMIFGCAVSFIPSSVTSLEDCCFERCSSLTSITIPSSVTSLGKYCFEGCN